MCALETCTIGIVMRGFFPPGELPNRHGMGEERDLAHWYEVYEAAELLYQRCVEGEDSAGWRSVG